METLFGWVCGVLFGIGLRPLYNLFTVGSYDWGKDMPLYKFPYIVHTDGSVEEFKD